jgi:hypothetical protein
MANESHRASPKVPVVAFPSGPLWPVNQPKALVVKNSDWTIGGETLNKYQHIWSVSVHGAPISGVIIRRDPCSLRKLNELLRGNFK